MKILMKTNIPKNNSAQSAEQSAASLEKIIVRRQRAAATKYGYISLGVRVLVIAAVVWVVFTQMFVITQAHGNYMFPAIKDGDLMIGFRMQQQYVKGDVVLCTVDGEEYVGRIVASGGDVITFSENGSMMVNGTTQTLEVVYPTYEKEALDYPYKVPEGTVFLMGDYRTQAVDSRDFGAVSKEDVQAKIITVMRRRTL